MRIVLVAESFDRNYVFSIDRDEGSEAGVDCRVSDLASLGVLCLQYADTSSATTFVTSELRSRESWLRSNKGEEGSVGIEAVSFEGDGRSIEVEAEGGRSDRVES